MTIEIEIFIGGKGWEHPTSLYARAWGPKGPWKIEWMKNIRGVLHAMQWINMSHGLQNFVSSQTQRGGSNTKLWDHGTSKSHKLMLDYNYLCRRAHMNRMVMKQHFVKSLVTYVFRLHLKVHDHTNLNIIFPWYGLQMSFEGPHNFIVTALDHSVRWP